MMDFLTTHWDSVLFVILSLFILLFLFKRGAKKRVYAMLFYLVTLAENEFGGGTGQLKFAAVTTWIYERLPVITKFLFTAKQIDKMIEDSVKKMKKYLEENMHARLLIMK